MIYYNSVYIFHISPIQYIDYDVYSGYNFMYGLHHMVAYQPPYNYLKHQTIEYLVKKE